MPNEPRYSSHRTLKMRQASAPIAPVPMMPTVLPFISNPTSGDLVMCVPREPTSGGWVESSQAQRMSQCEAEASSLGDRESAQH